MKKSLIIFIFVFAAGIVHAQTDKLEIGIEGGPNMTNYTLPAPNYEPSEANLYKFSAGITGQYDLTRHFSVKSGLIFEQKGYADVIDFTDNYGNFIKTTNDPNIFSYLILPAFAKISFGNKLKFFVNGGPYFGFLLNNTFISYPSNNDHPLIFNYTDHYNRFDFGASAGMGLERKILDKFIISLEARYNYGFLTTFKYSANSPYGRNGSADLLLGLRYRLGE